MDSKSRLQVGPPPIELGGQLIDVLLALVTPWRVAVHGGCGPGRLASPWRLDALVSQRAITKSFMRWRSSFECISTTLKKKG
jgi:hypothetical protein